MKIYKYPLKETVMMPKGASILTVQTQLDAVFIWAEIDPEADNEQTTNFLNKFLDKIINN